MSSPRKTRPFPPSGQRERQADRQTAGTLDKGHGRIERRTLTSMTKAFFPVTWPGFQQACRLQRQRTVHGKTEHETVYYITSLSRSRADATGLLALGRRHWGATENGLHYIRDTTLDEDHCTIVSGHAPQNLAACRNTALNWLRCRKTVNFAATVRGFTRNALKLFSILGFVK